MTRSRRAVVGSLAALFVLSVSVSAQDAARITASVSAITAGENNVQRREAIVKLLAERGVMAETRAFGDGTRAGVNLVVTLPGREARTILIGAHYDRVAVGQGAVDNAASCAALIELIGAFRAAPLGRYTLKFVFFDQEELGLLGSRAYLQSNSERPAYAINLDVFAYGDTLFVTSRQTDGALARAVQAAGEAHRIPVTIVPPDRYPGSDHLSMIAAGVETVGVALVDKADVDGVLAASPATLTPGTGPRILTIIHTPADTVAEVKSEQMARAIPLLEETVRTIERGR
jgi:Zn-dependent M28 family amino/carboxypeptidase